MKLFRSLQGMDCKEEKFSAEELEESIYQFWNSQEKNFSHELFHSSPLSCYLLFSLFVTKNEEKAFLEFLNAIS